MGKSKEELLEQYHITEEDIINASDEIRNDREVMYKAINTSHNKELFKYASHELQNDQSFIIEIIGKSGDGFGVLEFVPDQFKNNKDLFRDLIVNKDHGHALYYASDELKDDKEFITDLIDSCEYNSFFIENISDRLKDDEELMLQAINKDEYSFKYASTRLRDITDFVRKCVIEEPSNLEYVSDRIKNDKSFILDILKNSKWYNVEYVFKYMSNNLKDDREFVTDLADTSLIVLKYASDRIKSDQDAILKFFDKPLELYADKLDDKESLEMLCHSVKNIIKEISEVLKSDESFLENIIKKMGLPAFSKCIRTFTNHGFSTDLIHNVLTKLKNDFSVDQNGDDFKKAMELDSTKYPSIDAIISSVNPDYDKYILDVVKISMDAIGIEEYVKGGTYSQQAGFKTINYNSIVRAMYKLIEELLQRGDFKFELYNYGRRSPEYEEFRRQLAILTGLSVDCFTSALERKIRERQYFSYSNFTPEVCKMMTQKPVLFIGKDRSYYQTDMSDQGSYIEEVNNKKRDL